MKYAIILIIFLTSIQSFCQTHLFVEIKSKADYQRVMPYFYIEIDDSIELPDSCSLYMNTTFLEILNQFDKRKYVNFFSVGSFPDISEQSADSSIVNFEEAKNNYHFCSFESKNYEIKLSFDLTDKKLDFREVKSINGFTIPKFYIKDGELRYESINSTKLNLILAFE